MINKILCPVDFSDDSVNAAEYSNQLSILLNSELVLVHIKNLMAVSQGRLPMEGADLITDVENNARVQMSELVAKLSKANPNKVKSFLKVGINVGEALLETLKEHNPDLVVMYTAGITGVGDRITGTKTDKIIDKTSVPLLLVPGNSKFSSGQSIVYTTDNKGDEKLNLNYVVDLAKLLNAPIHILHILQSIEGKKEFNESLKLSDISNISYEIRESKDINKGIEEFSESKNAGIIVMNTYTRSFFEKLFSTSFTKNMAYNLKRPLLVLDKD